MWPIFHNVDQLDSIHAAWRLKKPKSNSPVPGKKVGGIAVATASGDGSLQSTSSLRSRSPESTSPLRQDQGSVPKGLGMERVQGPQGRGHEEGKGEEGDKRVGGGVRGREGQAVTEEVGVGAEEQKEEETQRTVRWNHGGKGALHCPVQCFNVMCSATPYHTTLCYTILCYIMPYHVLLLNAMPYYLVASHLIHLNQVLPYVHLFHSLFFLVRRRQ